LANRDYYEVLGIAKDASEAEIKKSYRQLARQYHPDANPGDPSAVERFKEITEAYEVLSDAEKRARYDRYGSAEAPSFEGAQGFDFGGGFSGMEDLFDTFFGGGGRQRRASPTPVRGADLEMRLDIDLEEAYKGASKEIDVRKIDKCHICDGTGAKPGTQPKTCPTCHGTGQLESAQGSLFDRFVMVRTCPHCRGEGQVVDVPCPECDGAGRLQKKRRIKVEVPPGVDTGLRLRLQGEGEAGQRGGPPGDLYVITVVKPHKLFTRKGDDLYLEASVGFPQVALGATLKVPTIDGPKVSLRVPEGTQPGAMLRLKAKGMPSLRRAHRGDLYVQVKVEVPTRLGPREKEILKELARIRGEEVNQEKSFFQKMKDGFGAG
jgi:molecular chaperone DnaJ